ncbi:MAG: hypothetical protein BGN87_00130 [Rhizobiales bacterium 65-79]|nr:hypothetical protein [Hyphomicrobiales bacterium]OJU02593.1 MAG: hypothetical protein BGN87_00130 [Rhizobiales bacterium 65-79]
MDAWLKGLIAAACIVIIGWGVYLGWQEFERQTTISREIQTRDALAEIVRLQRLEADAKLSMAAAEREKQSQIQSKRNACHQAANWLRDYAVMPQPKGAPPKDTLVSKIKICATDGTLDAGDAFDMKPYL